MRQSEAVAIIRDLVFMPGWTFEASVMSERECDLAGVPFEGGPVRLTHVIQTLNSNREDARQGYPEEITIAPSGVIPAEALDTRDEVIGVVLASALDVFQHEAREFLRDTGRDFCAPFHPHRPEGEKLFNSYFHA